MDPERYEGTCYRAANWLYLGLTTGEGLVRKGKTYTTTPKKIFMLPLAKDFQRALQSLPEAPATAKGTEQQEPACPTTEPPAACLKGGTWRAPKAAKQIVSKGKGSKGKASEAD